MLPHGAQGSREGSAVYLTKELRDSRIRVDAADPGYTATETSATTGARRVEESARAPRTWRPCPRTVPPGDFFADDGPLPW
jgi:hypothetical protein